ncbi:MAG TPA: type II toxin-antitoxin system prevent-host-death family antitoxin [Solirubrobacterales bacterium]|nr:type II toxin-antitoxin system prevent-host-death family antitoxin [Solirubrobacterales bacterium]
MIRGADAKCYGCRMTVEVASRELRNDTGGLLRRVEAGESIVITRRGKPVADLVPHRQESGRWLTPSEVIEIRKITSGDPTWGKELAEMRSADELGPIP